MYTIAPFAGSQRINGFALRTYDGSELEVNYVITTDEFLDKIEFSAIFFIVS